MSRRLFAHLAALRYQIRRVERAAVLGTVALIPCAVLLLTTLDANWMRLVLFFVLAGYLWRKGRQILRARRTVKQLRLEEQFVRHRPASTHLLTCTRRPNHLWTHSLTLKGLKAMLENPPPRRFSVKDQQHLVRRHYLRSFAPLWPSPFPVDLLWLAAVGLLWLWLIPDAYLQAPAPTVLAGAGLLLLILVGEIIQVVLQADLRGGFTHLTSLLSEWTLVQPFEETLQTVREKPYRHTSLYRASIPALTPLLS